MPRIGPNAVIRVAEALRARHGEGLAVRVFADAGLDRYLAAAPGGMIDEREVTALHRALRATLAGPCAELVAREAGRRTADYLLAHRIPPLAQTFLRPAPAWLASRILLGAIRGHSWTFAGGGVFTARAGAPVVVKVQGCPICRDAAAPAPVCGFYTATFERLFQALVHPRAVAVETACEARGASACVFEIGWRDRGRRAAPRQ